MERAHFKTRIHALLGASALCAFGGMASADQVILDDLIVDGSICAGLDCVNGESFGFDTLRLKENNLRIKAVDTSSTASFPSTDWEIMFNESSNGGKNVFAINDVDGGRRPFSIEALARSNALYVDDGGRIGFGTATPVVRLHAKDGNTPTLRLEQDGSSGFNPQTWDVAGNEANFFVRDSTNGSTLVFRIEPGADTNSLVIDASNDVGVGTNSPSASLHVRRTGGDAQLLVEDTGGSGPAQLIRMENNGAVQLYMDNTSNASAQWMFSAGSNMLLAPSDNTADAVFDLSATGDLTIDGSLTQLSDKHAKMAIVPVDNAEILAKVAALPVSSWTYIDDAETGVRHIGPMAQDFYAAFGTGHTDRGISSLDSAGVALAAIQALNARIEELEAQLAAQ